MAVSRVGTVERAFELASKPDIETLDELRRRLMAEQRPDASDHMNFSPSLRQQLKQKLDNRPRNSVPD